MASTPLSTVIQPDPLLVRLRQFKSRVIEKRDNPPWSASRLSLIFTSPPRFVSPLDDGEASEDGDGKREDLFENPACDDYERNDPVIKPTSGWQIESVSRRLRSPRDPNGPYEVDECVEEMYKTHFYGKEHWNFYSSDPDVGPVLLSLKQEATISREHFRVLVRAPSEFIHGLLPASCLSANRYSMEDVVSALGRDLNLTKPLKKVQLASFNDELLKLDQSFVVSDHKVGVVYVKDGQTREDEILGNGRGSAAFNGFLRLLGDRVSLKGFDGFRGGLDVRWGMTGEESVYSEWHGHRVMFHVATLLPGGDEQQVQRKRHIGNDMICVVFVDGMDTVFNPTAIRSHFLHSYIVVQCGEEDGHFVYKVSAVSRDGVPLCRPHLSNQNIFYHNSTFHEFLMAKIINGERACFRAPKFAELQNRTQNQMMQNMIISAEDAEAALKEGKNVKTAVGRRGSWLPVGCVRPPSPLVDSNQEKVEHVEQLSLDLKAAYLNRDLCDVIFLLGKQEIPVYGIRAILSARSSVLKNLLCSASASVHRKSSFTKSLNQRRERNYVKKLQLSAIPQEVADESPTSPIPVAIKKEKKKKGMREKLKMKFQRNSLKSALKEPKKESEQETTATSADVRIVAGKCLVPLPQFEFNDFEVIMEYFHTGCCSLTPDALPGVVCLAEFLELPDLEQACFDILRDSVNFESVWGLLKRLGDYLHFQSATSMCEKVIEFVEKNAQDFLCFPDVKDLPKNIFVKIVNRSLKVPEILKFKTCLSWADENCLPSSWKEEVGHLVNNIDYQRISPVDLIKIVVPSGTVDKDRVMMALAFHADPKSLLHVESPKKGNCLSRGSSSRETSCEPSDSGIDASSMGSHASLSGIGKRLGGGAYDEKKKSVCDLYVLPVDGEDDMQDVANMATHL
eukprot:m.2117 g.2117  ORF g.2117 m.2117 type:complete len:905 (+) comp8320_c0_seq2:329-3043(+)